MHGSWPTFNADFSSVDVRIDFEVVVVKIGFVMVNWNSAWLWYFWIGNCRLLIVLCVNRLFMSFFGFFCVCLPSPWLICRFCPFIASGLGLGFVKRVQKICTLDWNESCVYQYQCAKFVEQMRRETWIGLERPVWGAWCVFGWGPPFWTLFGQNKIISKRDKD